MGDLEQVDEEWVGVIKKGKNEKFDFVENTDDYALILQIITAFANTDGGDLLIGVNRKSKIIGVSPQQITRELEELITENRLINYVQFHTLYISHFILIRIKVSQVLEKISLIEGGQRGFYFRNGKNTVRANKIILRYWRMIAGSVPVNCNSESMKILLTLFSLNDQFSLARIYKETSLSNREVDQTVSCLLYMNKVSIVYNVESILFETKEN